MADSDKYVSKYTGEQIEAKLDSVGMHENRIQTLENKSAVYGLSSTLVGSSTSATSRWLRFDPQNKKGLIITAGTSITLANGEQAVYEESTPIDLSSMITQEGTDYFVYIDNEKNITASATKQLASDKVQIGRFHTLCVSVGDNVTMIAPASSHSDYAVNYTYLVKPYRAYEDPDFYAFYNKIITAVEVGSPYDVITCEHPLSGFEAGDILPESVFCLNWNPDCLIEDAMVYDRATDICVDIYLQSGTGEKTTSKYNVAHTVSRQPINHLADFLQVGKKMLTDVEFTSIALGSNECTSIINAADATTVGGHSDTNGRRMISAIGCEECCGYLWQWLDEIGPNGTTNWRTTDGKRSFGQEYGEPNVVSAGGDWGSASSCGSRSRASDLSRSDVAGSIGSRGSSRINKK